MFLLPPISGTGLISALLCSFCVLQVADAMVGKDKVVTVKPGALMSDAAQLMVHNDVSGFDTCAAHVACSMGNSTW